MQDDNNETTHSLISGVPQGGILSPLLYIIIIIITSNAKFGSNIDLRKLDILSQEKINECSCIVTNVSSFLKSMLLLNFMIC